MKKSKRVMKNWDSDFYLYSKYWYKRTNIIEDLKILQANYCGCEVKHITARDAVRHLISLTLNHMLTSGNPEYHLTELITSLNPTEMRKINSEETDDHDTKLCKACMSFLMNVETSKIEKGIDAPDFTLLPARDNHCKKMAKEF